jgi:hypothetical protein
VNVNVNVTLTVYHVRAVKSLVFSFALVLL